MKATDWPRYRYAGLVERIVDGDTCQILLDLGDRTYRTRRIRMLGYNAPEIVGADKAAGIASRDALADIIPVGCVVYVHTQLDRTSFERLLAHVYVEGSDGDLYAVSEAMISGGFGVAA